jgi:hypothetical protein
MLALAVGALTAVQAASAQPRECGPVKPPPKAPAPPAECGKKVEPPVVNLPDGVFLCYSKFQTEPGVWMQDQAAELLAAGYWYPNALPGNVDGGTNVGSFHLVCNASGTPTGMFVNENGEVVSADYAARNLGHYPQLG